MIWLIMLDLVDLSWYNICRNKDIWMESFFEFIEQESRTLISWFREEKEKLIRWWYEFCNVMEFRVYRGCLFSLPSVYSCSCICSFALEFHSNLHIVCYAVIFPYICKLLSLYNKRLSVVICIYIYIRDYFLINNSLHS